MTVFGFWTFVFRALFIHSVVFLTLNSTMVSKTPVLTYGEIVSKNIIEDN